MFNKKPSWLMPTLIASAVAISLGACSSDDDDNVVADDTTEVVTPAPDPGPTFPEGAIMIEDGENLTIRIQEALINAQSNDVIVLPKGNFEIESTLLFDGDVDGDGSYAKNVTIMGYGMEDTVLDFSNANSGDGIFVRNRCPHRQQTHQGSQSHTNQPSH